MNPIERGQVLQGYSPGEQLVRGTPHRRAWPRPCVYRLLLASPLVERGGPVRVTQLAPASLQLDGLAGPAAEDEYDQTSSQKQKSKQHSKTRKQKKRNK